MMIKHVTAGLAVAAGTFGVMGASTGASPPQDFKKAFPVECTSGTLVGQTLTVVAGKTAFMADGTQLRVATFHAEFGDETIDKGKTPGALSCGGAEVSPEGTFTFFVTLNEVTSKK